MSTRIDPSRVIRAPRGTQLSCKSWLTEAAYRMIQNNLDAEVAENPTELVVYGGIGRAARDWECYDAILESLRDLGDDETLLVQSGKPVGVFPTHADAPRVLLANSNLVPHWATWEHFNELDRKGLMMYGQMTAGSWIYIGSAGHRPGHLRDVRRDGPPALRRRPQRQVDPHRRPRRHGRRAAAGRDAGRRVQPQHRMPAEEHRHAPAHALRRRAGQRPRRRARAHREVLRRRRGEVDRAARQRRRDPARTRAPRRAPGRGHRPDQRARSGARLPADRLERRAVAAPNRSATRSTCATRRRSRCACTSRRCLRSRTWASRCSTTATTSARWRKDEGCVNAFDFPGFVPAYVRPLFCRGVGPFRWVALSGDPEDIARTDAKVKELIPDDEHLHRWLDMAAERISFQHFA